MNTTNELTANPISELENRPVGEIESQQEIDPISTKREKSAKPQSRKAVSVVLEERIFKRRNNINSLPGLMREHARLIALIRNGEIPLDKGEVLSRAYGRHKEMVSAHEMRQQNEAIQKQLEALRDSQGLLPLDTRHLGDVVGDEDGK